MRMATNARPAFNWLATVGHALPRVLQAPIKTVPLGVPVKLQLVVFIAKRLAVCNVARTPPVSLIAFAKHRIAPVAIPDLNSGNVTVLDAVRGEAPNVLAATSYSMSNCSSIADNDLTM